jgi:hypothetical protein
VSATYDFYNPFVSARIVTVDGGLFPLWVGAPSDQGGVSSEAWNRVGFQGRSLAMLQEVQIVLNLGFIPVITATLVPTYAEAIEFLNSALIEWGQSTLEVQFGYVGRGTECPVLSPIFSGTILKPDVSLGADISITLRAQGVGGFSAARQESSRIVSGESRRDAIERVLSGRDPVYQRRVRVDFSEVERVGGSPLEALNGSVGAIVQGYQSDWTFIWRLVRECQCWMILIEDTLKIFPRDAAVTKPPKLTLALYDFVAPHNTGASGVADRLGPSVGVFPILSASSPTMAVYAPGAVRGLVMQGIHSEDREAWQRIFGDEEVRPARTNEGSSDGGTSDANPGNAADGDGGTFHFGDVDNLQVEAQARAEFSDQTFAMGVKLEVETLGIPDLIPGEVVRVHGLGRRMDHNYVVHEVKHTIGTNGYVTSLSLMSNTNRILSTALSQLTPLGDINTHEGDPPSEQSRTTVNPEEQSGFDPYSVEGI